MEYSYVKGRIDLGMTTVDVSGDRTAMASIDQVTSGSNAEQMGFRSGELF